MNMEGSPKPPPGPAISKVVTTTLLTQNSFLKLWLSYHPLSHDLSRKLSANIHVQHSLIVLTPLPHHPLHHLTAFCLHQVSTLSSWALTQRSTDQLKHPNFSNGFSSFLL